MSLENRSSSAMFKRAEQLKRWEESATNLEEIEPKLHSRKIQFSSGCVFLAACAASDKDEVLRLIDNGADIDTANVDGLTALHQACIDDNLDMVEFLVGHGADVNRGDNEGWTPLHATASCGFISIAKYLIESGANVAAVNNDGELPLDIAESDAMDDILQEMIDAKGIDCEEARSREETMMLGDAKEWLNGKSEGFDPLSPHPKTGATALHVAAAKGYIKVMSILLQGHASVDNQDYDGWTALHAAAHWGQKEAAEMLVEHFCDMDLKNCVGQTAVDVADAEMVKTLDNLRTKQAALHKDRPAPDNINNKTHNSPKRRMSGTDKTNIITKDTTTERQILDRTISEEESTTTTTTAAGTPGEGGGVKRVQVNIDSQEREKEDDSSPTENSQLDLKNRGEEEQSSRLEDDDAATTPWRRPGSFRNRNETAQPTPPSRNLNLHIEKRDTLSTNKLPTPPSDVILRRTHSFEADEKFYRRYLELQARIASSCPTLHPPTCGPGSGVPVVPVKLPARSASLREHRPARRSRGGVSSNTDDVTTSSTTPTATSPTRTTTTTTSSPTSVNTPAIRSTQTPSTPTVVPPTPPVTPSTPSTPTTPGGSKISPGNIFKNFFKSFVPPVRDEESETQRKAHAKRVRETRRSTQGVTLEEIKTAEQLVKKKNQQINNNNNNNNTNNNITDTFLLEDARDKTTSGSSESLYRRQQQQAVVTPVEVLNDTTVTLPLRTTTTTTNSIEDKENDSRNVLATQAVIQRRRKPKRRSTGVVHVDMEEIDPDRQDTGGVGAGGDTHSLPNNDESGGDRSSRSSSRLSSLSTSGGDATKTTAATTVSAAAAAATTENGEIDYKKLYEESLVINDRLRDRLKKTEEELKEVKSNNNKTTMSELEKRERRAMERKLSEMEEELKLLDALKQENQRLKDENGALIRVISKLSK